MTIQEKNSYRVERKSQAGFWGLALLVALFFGSRELGLFSSPIGDALLSWPAFIFGFGVLALLDRKVTTFLVMTSVAAFFWVPFFKVQYPEQLWFVPSVGFFGTYWWVLLAAIALIMFVKQLVFPSPRYFDNRTSTCDRKNTAIDQEPGEFLKTEVVFSSKERVVFSDQFKGGEVHVAFGSQVIDLRKCELAAGRRVVLRLEVAFGSCEVLVPSDWHVSEHCSNAFSSLYCRPDQGESSEEKRLVIEGSVAFSSLEIR